MQKYMILVNEVPGTQVKAVLSPGDKLGTADMTLVTENIPEAAIVSYDNYGTRYIGPQQMTGNLYLHSFFTSGDITNFKLTKTPKGRELTYMEGSYESAINTEGERLLVGTNYAHTRPQFILDVADIEGIANNFYVTMFFPWWRTTSDSFTWHGGVNYKDSKVTAAGSLLYIDHVRNAGVGFKYEFADKYYGLNSILADVVQGFPLFGATTNGNVDTALTSRPGATGKYTKVQATASRIQSIKGPVSLFVIGTGQWSVQPLLSAEQFSFGGSQLGRGYDTAEIIGDKGIGAGTELRLDWNVEKLLLKTIQFYTFYDIGAVWNYKFVGGVPVKQSASSTGLGMRFDTSKNISGNFMWAQPLTKSVAAEEFIHDGWRPRVFFSLVANFA